LNPILFRLRYHLCESGGVKAHHDLRGKLLYCFHSLMLYPYVWGAWLSRSLGIVLEEIRSLFGRILIRYKSQPQQILGRVWEMDSTQRLVLCKRTQARSACISNMVSK